MSLTSSSIFEFRYGECEPKVYFRSHLRFSSPAERELCFASIWHQGGKLKFREKLTIDIVEIRKKGNEVIYVYRYTNQAGQLVQEEATQLSSSPSDRKFKRVFEGRTITFKLKGLLLPFLIDTYDKREQAFYSIWKNGNLQHNDVALINSVQEIGGKQFYGYQIKRGDEIERASALQIERPLARVHEIALRAIGEISFGVTLLSLLSAIIALLLSPLSYLWSLVWNKDEREIAFKQMVQDLTPVDYQRGCHNQMSVLSHLRFIGELFRENGDSSPAIDQVTSVLEKGYTLGRQLYLAHRSQDQAAIAVALKKLSAEVRALFNNIDDETIPLLIPIGLGERQEFTPHFLVFERKGSKPNHKLLLKHIHLQSPSLNANSTQVVTTYDMTEMMSENREKSFFLALLSLQPLLQSSTPPTLETQRGARVGGPTFNNHAIETLIVSYKGRVVAQAGPIKLQKGSRDPVKALFTVIKELGIKDKNPDSERALEAIISSKARFYQFYTNKLITFLKSNEEGLNTKQKIQILKAIQWYTGKCRHYLEKEAGIRVAIEVTDPLLATITELLGINEGTVKRERQEVRQLNSRITLFSSPLPQPISATLKTNAISEKRVTITNVRAKEMLEIQKLKKMLSSSDYPIQKKRELAFTQFNKIYRRIDSHLSNNNPKVAKILLFSLLRALPPPESAERETQVFWDYLATNDEIEKWTKAVFKTAERMMEAALRSGEFPLGPEEVFEFNVVIPLTLRKLFQKRLECRRKEFEAVTAPFESQHPILSKLMQMQEYHQSRFSEFFNPFIRENSHDREFIQKIKKDFIGVEASVPGFLPPGGMPSSDWYPMSPQRLNYPLPEFVRIKEMFKASMEHSLKESGLRGEELQKMKELIGPEFEKQFPHFDELNEELSEFLEKAHEAIVEDYKTFYSWLEGPRTFQEIENKFNALIVKHREKFKTLLKDYSLKLRQSMERLSNNFIGFFRRKGGEIFGGGIAPLRETFIQAYIKKFTLLFKPYEEQASRLERLYVEKERLALERVTLLESRVWSTLRDKWRAEDEQEPQLLKDYEEAFKIHLKARAQWGEYLQAKLEVNRRNKEAQETFNREYSLYTQKKAVYDALLPRQKSQLDEPISPQCAFIPDPPPPEYEYRTGNEPPIKPEKLEFLDRGGTDEGWQKKKRGEREEELLRRRRKALDEDFFLKHLLEINIANLTPFDWFGRENVPASEKHAPLIRNLMGYFASMVGVTKEVYTHRYYDHHKGVAAHLALNSPRDLFLMRKDHSLLLGTHPELERRIGGCERFFKTLSGYTVADSNHQRYSKIGFLLGFNKKEKGLFLPESDELAPLERSVSFAMQGFFNAREGIEHLAPPEITLLARHDRMREILENPASNLETFYSSALSYRMGRCFFGSKLTNDDLKKKFASHGRIRMVYGLQGSRFNQSHLPTFILSSDQNPSGSYCTTQVRPSEVSTTTARKDFLGQATVEDVDRYMGQDGERRALSDATNADEQRELNPLERYMLKQTALASTQESEDSRPSRFSHLSIRLAIFFIQHNIDLLKDERVQHTLYAHLFQRGLLKEGIEKHPDFFKWVGLPLTEFVTYLSKKASSEMAYHGAVLFIRDLAGKIRRHTQELARQKAWGGESERIAKEISDSLPKYDEEQIDFASHLQDNYQKLFALYFLNYLSQERKPLQTAQELRQALIAYAILVRSPVQLGHSGMVSDVEHFAQEVLFPNVVKFLHHADGPTKAEFLKSLTNQAASGQWEQKGENYYVFYGLKEGKKRVIHTVDLRTGEGIAVTIKLGSYGHLPTEIVKDPVGDFKFLFKEANPFVSSQPILDASGRRTKNLEFSWVDAKTDVAYSLLYCPKEARQEATYQIFQICRGKKYRFVRLKVSDPLAQAFFSQGNSTVERLLIERGAWVLIDSRGQEDLSNVLVVSNDTLENDPIRLHIKNREIIGATLGEGRERKWICRNLARGERELLSFKGLQGLLLLSSDGTHVDEIRFLQGLALKRRDPRSNVWVVAGREDWEWQLNNTTHLETRFGENYRQFILPLRNKRSGEEEFWVYPYLMQSLGKKGSPLKPLKKASEFIDFLELLCNRCIQSLGIGEENRERKPLMQLIQGQANEVFKFLEDNPWKGTPDSFFDDLRGFAVVIDDYLNGKLNSLENWLIQRAQGESGFTLQEMESKFKEIFAMFKTFFDPPPLKFVIDNHGESASHATFLYLSSLAALRGDFGSASRSLELMVENGETNTQEEISHLEFVMNSILLRDFAMQTADGHLALPNTDRKVAYQLKMLLALKKIEKRLAAQHTRKFDSILVKLAELIGQKERAGLVEKAMFASLASSYRNFVESRKEELKALGLLLDQDELKLLREIVPINIVHVMNSSILGLNANPMMQQVKEILGLLPPTKPKTMPIEYELPTPSDVEKLVKVILENIDPNQHGNIEALHRVEGSAPKWQTLISHFWSYVDWIYRSEIPLYDAKGKPSLDAKGKPKKRGITIDDLAFLFQEIPMRARHRKELITARTLLLLFYFSKEGMSGRLDPLKDASILNRHTFLTQLNKIKELAHQLPNFRQMEQMNVDYRHIQSTHPTAFNVLKYHTLRHYHTFRKRIQDGKQPLTEGGLQYSDSTIAYDFTTASLTFFRLLSDVFKEKQPFVLTLDGVVTKKPAVADAAAPAVAVNLPAPSPDLVLTPALATARNLPVAPPSSAHPSSPSALPPPAPSGQKQHNPLAPVHTATTKEEKKSQPPDSLSSSVRLPASSATPAVAPVIPPPAAPAKKTIWKVISRRLPRVVAPQRQEGVPPPKRAAVKRVLTRGELEEEEWEGFKQSVLQLPSMILKLMGGGNDPWNLKPILDLIEQNFNELKPHFSHLLEHDNFETAYEELISSLHIQEWLQLFDLKIDISQFLEILNDSKLKTFNAKKWGHAASSDVEEGLRGQASLGRQIASQVGQDLLSIFARVFLPIPDDIVDGGEEIAREGHYITTLSREQQAPYLFAYILDKIKQNLQVAHAHYIAEKATIAKEVRDVRENREIPIAMGDALASNHWETLFQAIDQNSEAWKTKWERKKQVAKGYFPPSDSPVEQHENRKQIKGIDLASEELKRECNRSLQVGRVKKLKQEILNRLTLLERKERHLKREILGYARTYAESLGLLPLYADRGRITEKQILETLLDRYQKGEIVSLELETMITTFLFVATEAQQLKKAQEIWGGLWKHLTKLCQKLPFMLWSNEAKRNWVQNQANQDVGWLLQSYELHQYLTEGANRLRYAKKNRATGEATPFLDDPEIFRRYLVSDYRKHQISRVKAKEAIEKLMRGTPRTIVLTTAPLLAKVKSELGAKGYFFDIGTFFKEGGVDLETIRAVLQNLNRLKDEEKTLISSREQLEALEECIHFVESKDPREGLGEGLALLKEIKAFFEREHPAEYYDGEKEFRKAINHPVRFIKIRMGVGKSSTIFPHVTKLLIEEGRQPVVTTTEELIGQLASFMNVMDKRAFLFEFNINFGLEKKGEEEDHETYYKRVIVHLENLDQTLKNLKKEKRYVLTTPYRLAAIRNKRLQLQKDLQKETDTQKKASIFNALQCMKSIEDYFHQEEVVLLQDEEVNRAITFEYNNAIGKSSIVNQTLFNMAEKLMFSILENQELKEMIDQNTLRALPDIQEGLKPVARRLFLEMNAASVLHVEPRFNAFKNELKTLLSRTTRGEMTPTEALAQVKDSLGRLLRTDALLEKLSNSKDPLTVLKAVDQFFKGMNFWQTLGWPKLDFSVVSEEQFTDYILGRRESPPEGLPQEWDDTLALQLSYIAALKSLLTTTFSAVYDTHMTLDRGFKRENGCTVVPYSKGIEKFNTQYGGQHEFILHHALHYFFHAKNFNEELFDKMFKELAINENQISEFNQETWAQWTKRIGAIALKHTLPSNYHALLHPESIKERLEFLRYLMLSTDFMKVFLEQIICNSQDIGSSDVRMGSGTGDAYSLNLSDYENDHSSDPDVITAKTLLLFGAVNDGEKDGEEASVAGQGLHKRVKIFEDPESFMTMCAADENCRAVINTGFEVHQNRAELFVRHLRQTPATCHRQFIYRDSKKRKPLIWNAGNQHHPEAYDVDTVDKKKGFFVYFPSDSRGVDFAIPSGPDIYGVIMVDIGTTLTDLNQAAGRMRKFGYGQRGEVAIDHKMAKKVRKLNKLESHVPITIGHVINAIKKMTIEENDHEHIKSTTFRIKSILKKVDRIVRMAYDVENMRDTSILQAFEEVMFEPHRELYIIKETIDWKNLYRAQRKIDQVEFIRNTYKKQLLQLDGIRRRFEEQYRLFEQRHPLNDGAIDAIANPFKRNSMRKIQVQIRQRRLALNATYDEIEKVLTDEMVKFGVPKELKEFLSNRKYIPPYRIEGDERVLRYYRNNLSPQIISNLNDNSRNEQQVESEQQQEQQPEQQPQQLNKQMPRMIPDSDSIPALKFSQFKNPTFEPGEYTIGKSPNISAPYYITTNEPEDNFVAINDMGFYSSLRKPLSALLKPKMASIVDKLKGLHLSARAKAFLNYIDRKNHPTLFLLFIKRADGSLHSCIVTQTDWEETIAPALVNERARSETPLALFALDPIPKKKFVLEHGKKVLASTTTFTRLILDAGKSSLIHEIQNHPDYTRMMVMNKIYLDWPQFTKTERDYFLQAFTATQQLYEETKAFLQLGATEDSLFRTIGAPIFLRILRKLHEQHKLHYQTHPLSPPPASQASPALPNAGATNPSASNPKPPPAPPPVPLPAYPHKTEKEEKKGGPPASPVFSLASPPLLPEHLRHAPPTGPDTRQSDAVLVDPFGFGADYDPHDDEAHALALQKKIDAAIKYVNASLPQLGGFRN